MTSHCSLPPSVLERLKKLALTLIDQNAARVLVSPMRNESGFWFGGGNLAADGPNRIWLVGRYRNFGDSRTGLGKGERGLKCTLFVSTDRGTSFAPVRTWTKADLSTSDSTVLSIEGAALHRCANGGWELFVSSEKAEAYPDGVAEYQKPGTGVWSIDVMSGDSPETLDAGALSRVLPNPGETPDPCYLHYKDPVVFNRADGATVLVFCVHPYCWTCSNTGFAVRHPGETRFDVGMKQMVGRGPAWDVAVTRVTSRLPLPRLGVLRDLPPVSLWFYDGAECVRQHEQNAQGVQRPRGYSCEEIGGAMVGCDDAFPALERLSRVHPFFTSPWGTGCSRYVDALRLDDGILAVWQQSRPDLSQPLVGHFLPMEKVEAILS